MDGYAPVAACYLGQEGCGVESDLRISSGQMHCQKVASARFCRERCI
jgi:hypothetical protein